MLSSANTNLTKAECHGFIMAPDATSPYDIRPCPHPPSRPIVLSEGCRVRNSSCAKGRYCEVHHCAWCKKESQAKAEKEEQGREAGQNNTAPAASEARPNDLDKVKVNA